jgi:outer membrane protein OmpA-like peptidoglycan-associated protein
MKKVLLSEAQLEMLVNYIKEEESNKQVIEEGWKEVVLGAAMLMGVGLTGANAQTANKALDDEATLKKIEQTLEGPEIEKLANTLEKAGLDDAMEKIQANADQIINAYNYAAEKKKVNFQLSRVYNTRNPKMVKSKIKQGYAVQDIEVTKDTIIHKKGEIQLAQEVEMVFDANIFKTGTFDLEDSIKTELQSQVEAITMLGGKITGIEIYSSTDTEPIKMGNEKLAQLRADGVSKFLQSIGVTVSPEIVTQPEQGPELDWRSMGSSERKQARETTAEYRYVKVVIHSVVEPAPQEQETVIEVVERVKYTLVKGYNLTTKTVDPFRGKKSYKTKTKKYKCKKVKVKGVPMDCEMFGGSKMSWAQ